MRNTNPDDPRCPECGGPIGTTSAYCMHCSADLTEDPEQTALDNGGSRNRTDGRSTSHVTSPSDDAIDSGEPLLDPDGVGAKLLTAVVGLIGGFLVGVLVMVLVTGMVSAGIGIATGVLVWLGVTVYTLRRRTVQEAVSKVAYGLAIVLVFYSLIPFSSTWDADSLNTRLTDFIGLLVILAVPVTVTGGIGYLAGRFVPEYDSE